LNLYALFHLNLAYSSIEEEQRPDVLRLCYWPLLRLARRYGLPFGIEATGFTLEMAREIDPAWFEEFRHLVTEGPCEFVGSGHVQLIGPLVPAEVNAVNQRLGQDSYEQLLGFRPRIALVNEQAYSAGMVQHYSDAGYRAIIMEWDNPASSHPDWRAEWRYLPQYACGADGERGEGSGKQGAESKERRGGSTEQSSPLQAPSSVLHAPHSAEEIPVIWNKSIAFQKFQRYAHGEMELDEYHEYLCGHLAETPRAFPLYGNDVEIFDFRPGRYHTEATLREDSEWDRIGCLFENLLADQRFRFVSPSQVLELLDQPRAGNRLHLESPTIPVPVKKQGKYNITRWAVTGRDDLGINTACWEIYEGLKANDQASDEDWRDLCYLWSSDLRTHITDNRWGDYRKRLAAAPSGLRLAGTTRRSRDCDISGPGTTEANRVLANSATLGAGPFRVDRNGRMLTIESARLEVRLNCARGLALDAFIDREISDLPLCGTLHHGYYDDINWGADYYTGHLVFETPARPKITDLAPVEPQLGEEGGGLTVSSLVRTPLGDVEKIWRLDPEKGTLELVYHLAWADSPATGSLRLGHITLIPEAFDERSLYYGTHNGGWTAERFPLDDMTVDHGKPVSLFLSASRAIGITEGAVQIGDAHRSLHVHIDKTQSALIGLVTKRRVGNQCFCRLSLSAREVDDTSRDGKVGSLKAGITIRAERGVEKEDPRANSQRDFAIA